MWRQGLFVAFLSSALLADSKSVSPKCTRPTIEWKIDWGKQPTSLDMFSEFYPSPGEIVSGIKVSSVMNLVGLTWNAESFLEIDGLICVRYGPLLNKVAGGDIVRDECDDTIAALRGENRYDLEGLCNDYWDSLSLDQMVQRNIRYYDHCISTDTVFYNASNIIAYTGICDIDPLATVYSHDIIEKGSEIFFYLLNWLGPSPFSGDVFGACSVLRTFLNMEKGDITHGLKSTLTFIMADILEYLKDLSICDVEGDINVAARDILVLLSGMTRSSLCSFVWRTHTREQYLDLGSIIVDNLFSVPTNAIMCNGVLDILLPYDEEDMLPTITGYEFISRDQRQEFCNHIAMSLSESSTYIPSPYMLPDSFDIYSWNAFENPGELLPSFFFDDAVNIIGAFTRSTTPIQGASVLCTEFENTLSGSDWEFAGRVSETCTFIRDGDSAKIEQMCLEMTVPLQYGERYPITLRRLPTALYICVVGVDAVRKFFEFTKIAQSDVCKAMDDFYYSDNNLQSVVRFPLHAYLAEFLPLADSICKDYENVLCELGPGCNVANAEEQHYFEGMVEDINKIIVTVLGVSNRQELCNEISSGIDHSSGTSNEDFVSELESASLLFLTNKERCVNVITISLQLIGDRIPGLNMQEELYKYTGYKTSQDLCTQLTSSFECNGVLPIQTSYFLVICVTIWNLVKISFLQI